jgi:hypothetical protein
LRDIESFNSRIPDSPYTPKINVKVNYEDVKLNFEDSTIAKNRAAVNE